MEAAAGKININRKLCICWITILFMLFTTGCWDRTEINDIALITATAYDLTPEGGIQYTVQIMLPSGGAAKSNEGNSGGQSKKSFITKTATGIDVGDAEKNIQKSFPRKLFRGHRRVIVIGEELARHGLQDFLDSISRDPQNRLRTNILVAKGKKGSDLLNMDYPLERVPTEAMREMVGIGIGIEANIRDFILTSSSEGIQPIGITIESDDNKEAFNLTGIAIFKDLKLVGYLNNEETEGYLWTIGKYNKSIIAATVPENEGVFRINIRSAKANIKTKFEGNNIKAIIELKGEGPIYANSTKIDLTIPKNIALAEAAIETRIKNQVQNTIMLIQKEYGADILGFGNTIYQHNPKQWKQLAGKWNDIFPDIEVSVSVDFRIRMTGMSGPPLYLKENEVKK